MVPILQTVSQKHTCRPTASYFVRANISELGCRYVLRLTCVQQELMMLV